MSAFLAHLVGMALGSPAPGAARLSLPPRFAQTPSAGIETWALSEASEQMPVAAPVSVHRTTGTDPAPAGHESPERPNSVPVDPVATGDTLPKIVPPVRTIKEPHPPAPDDLPQESQPTAAAVYDVAAPPARLRPSAGVTPSPAAAGDAGVLRPLGVRPAPLSAATMDARIAAPSQERPVINVTIDRLELRGPASPARSPEQRRTAAQPTLSLSEYLRGSGKSVV